MRTLQPAGIATILLLMMMMPLLSALTQGLRPLEAGGQAAFWKVAVHPLQSIWRPESGE